MVRCAIDIGGTFTDIVVETPDVLRSIKVLTTPTNPAQGALDGVARLLGALGKTHRDLTSVIHGTTLATNALIERRGAKTAFVTTAGFRDVLDMRDEKRFAQYDLNIELPKSLVARPLRFGLPERILADGSVLTAPSDADIDALGVEILAQNVQAVAVGFLHTYCNPTHENYVADRLQGILGPDITICQSAEVAGEIREYERFSTVCANAYVRPLMSRYLGELDRELIALGFAGSFLLMLSGGGLTTLDQAMKFPIRLVESGPAGGVALAAHVARDVGSKKTLSLDIGGTTAKICFIENGQPQTTRKFEVARAWRDVKGSGLPVRVPTVELVEIGAGGGSTASVDILGRLKVGPHSAGADPGPAAYGRGGTDATITDAHLTLGNIAADGFAGGMITLQPDASTAAIDRHIRTPLGMNSPETAAAGIVELADETMANAARVHGVELGHDIASFDLLVTGGGGALHGARIAEKLGIRRIIVPQNAGVGSAVGFLRSPVAFESAVSVMRTLDQIDPDDLMRRIDAQISHVCGIVQKAVPADAIAVTVQADLRYKGQGLEIAVKLDDLGAGLRDLSATFEGRYKALVGFVVKDVPIEMVSVSVTAREQRTIEPQPYVASVEAVETTDRQVFDLNAKRHLTYDVVPRSGVTQNRMQGPMVVTEAQTTTLVRLDWTVWSTDAGHLIVERDA